MTSNQSPGADSMRLEAYRDILGGYWMVACPRQKIGPEICHGNRVQPTRSQGKGRRYPVANRASLCRRGSEQRRQKTQLRNEVQDSTHGIESHMNRKRQHPRPRQASRNRAGNTLVPEKPHSLSHRHADHPQVVHVCSDHSRMACRSDRGRFARFASLRSHFRTASDTPP